MVSDQFIYVHTHNILCYVLMCAQHVQVLEVVRSNYDSLTLKLQDNLDHFDKYAEKLKESTFFTQLVSSSNNTLLYNDIIILVHRFVLSFQR